MKRVVRQYISAAAFVIVIALIAMALIKGNHQTKIALSLVLMLLAALAVWTEIL